MPDMVALRKRAALAAVPIHTTPLYARERILMFGKEGTSKTHAWMSIAEAYPDVPFYCVDTDDSVQRMLEGDFSGLHNIHVEVAQNWEEFDASCKKFLQWIDAWVSENPPTRKEDYPWLVIDFSDTTWDMVQNYFTEQVFDQGVADYFLAARKGLKGKGGTLQPLEGWTDWQVINKIFQSRWNSLTKGGGPYHLYLTAGSTAVSGIENRSLYKSLKFMPRGEKRMAHRVHTVLMSSVDGSGWYLSSAKDRGRELLMDRLTPNFSISYLMKVAGWER